MLDEYAPPLEEIMEMPMPAKSQFPRPVKATDRAMPVKREPKRMRMSRVYKLLVVAWLSGFSAGFVWYWIVSLAKFVIRVI